MVEAHSATFTLNTKNQTEYLLGIKDDFTSPQLAALNVNGDGVIDVADIVSRVNQFLYVPLDFPTIQQAIDEATDGDEIVVSPGTYVENIFFKGKNIVLRSTDPSSNTIRETTIIDGNLVGSVVTFDGTEGCACTLAGFTITNGVGTYFGTRFDGLELYGGGGIHGGGTDTDEGTHATIEYNIVRDNRSTTRTFGNFSARGSGIWNCDGLIQYNIVKCNIRENTEGIIRPEFIGSGIMQCDGIIQYNLIEENEGNGGGGLSNCLATFIQYNVIRNNIARNGAGLNACGGIIQNNLIYNNTATEFDGGGINDVGFYDTPPIIQNNIIVGNHATFGFFGAGSGAAVFLSTIRNCIIWGNTSDDGVQYAGDSIPSYCDIEGWTGGGEGNFSLDPRFVDAMNFNFRLLPGSPCIDTGSSATLFLDFDGNPRPLDGDGQGAGSTGDGSDYDIGAFEFVP